MTQLLMVLSSENMWSPVFRIQKALKSWTRIYFLSQVAFMITNSSIHKWDDITRRFCKTLLWPQYTHNMSMSSTIHWFIANKLVLNIDKTNINFAPKQSANSLLAVSFGNMLMNEVSVITFLSIQIDNKLNWKSLKHSSTIFVIRCLSYFMNLKTLQMVYFSYFHSIIKYGIVLWGNRHFRGTYNHLWGRRVSQTRNQHKAGSLPMKMHVIHSFEALGDFHQTTWC
jgi:hypothetical protein